MEISLVRKRLCAEGVLLNRGFCILLFRVALGYPFAGWASVDQRRLFMCASASVAIWRLQRGLVWSSTGLGGCTGLIRALDIDIQILV